MALASTVEGLVHPLSLLGGSILGPNGAEQASMSQDPKPLAARR
jgi:hypothetical protein